MLAIGQSFAIRPHIVVEEAGSCLYSRKPYIQKKMEVLLVRVETRAVKVFLPVIFIPDPANGWKELFSSGQ